MDTSIVAYEEAHLSIRLRYEADEGEGPLALAEQAIAALETLADGWLEPLAWEMDVGCFDTELMDAPMNPKPPQPYWLLRKERIPAGVEIDPFYTNHTVATEPVLSADRIHSWIARALAQTCAEAPRFVPYWNSFHSVAMRACLPQTSWKPTQESIGVNCYAGGLIIPLDLIGGHAWVSGRPEGYLIGPPVRLTVGNLYGMVIKLNLAVYWTPWIQDPAGRALVDAAVDRVLALGRGWQRSED